LVNKAILVLEDGSFYNGYSFGAEGDSYGEVVFNTSMSGYQEVLTDPSYSQQMVVMTCPMIGNYGINSEDIESDKVQVAGFVVKEYSKTYSNYRANLSLGDYLKKHSICGIEGIDTRALTKRLRDKGAMRGIISTSEFDVKKLVELVQKSPSMNGADLVKDSTCGDKYECTEKTNVALQAYPLKRKYSKTKVAVYDFGIKKNILRMLNDRGCEVEIFPATVPYKIIEAEFKPDGWFLSNGPGDPSAVTYAIDNIKGIIASGKPVFGICLGHQLLALALGAKTYKLKFGHRGANQPVMNMSTKKVEITSQNHGFCVDSKTLPEEVVVSHLNLNDNTVEGFRHKTLPIFCVQYHPESSPGPHDSDYLFDEFVDSINSFRKLSSIS